jgi:hypothetical protein
MSIGNLKDSGNLGNNFPWQLKMLQGLQGIYDEVKKPLTCLEDSVALCAPIGGLNVNLHDGLGAPITSTVNGTDRGIDVNIINALPLEINLDAANDQVGIYGYTNIADPTSFTGIKVNASGQLDIRPLTCVDKLSLCFNDGVSDVTVSSTNPLPVNAIVTVPSALDTALFAFDITSGVNEALTTTETSPGTHALDVNLTTRLDCTTDSISICDPVSGGALVVNNPGGPSDGSINTRILDDVGNPITSLASGSRRGLDVNILTPTIAVSIGSLVETGVIGDLSSFGPSITSISFQNIGTTAATISVDGGANFFPLAPGTSINLDPRIPMGYYDGTSFFWDATALGASLLIIYNYI